LSAADVEDGAPGPEIGITVPCKGRLAFLKQTAPALIGRPRVRYCLVDYDCPERCGDWAEQTFPAEVAAARLVIERVGDRPHFNKGAAHNLGAQRLISEGVQHLCFLDADTVCDPAFTSWLRPRVAAPDRFWIAGRKPNGWEDPGFVGFLALPAALFVASGGFDQWFEEWGGEDLELRVRLHLEHGAAFGEVPLSFFTELRHGDALRTQFRKIANPDQSNRLNIVYWARKLRRRTGKSLTELDETAKRLFACIPHRNLPGAPA
jgi:hypothetical protein